MKDPDVAFRGCSRLDTHFIMDLIPQSLMLLMALSRRAKSVDLGLWVAEKRAFGLP